MLLYRSAKVSISGRAPEGAGSRALRVPQALASSGNWSVCADSKAVADAYKSVQDKQKSTIDKNEADVKAGMDKYAKKK